MKAKNYLLLGACFLTHLLSFSVGAEDHPVRVGLVLDRGGKDDQSFNTAAFEGATRAAKELGIVLKDVESPDTGAFEPALRRFAEKDFDLVIGVGFGQKEALEKVSAQFPKVHFALVDAVVEKSNVRSLLFQEHEGSFIVGYLAGLMTKTNRVGFVGGMDIPMIRRFQMAYEAGVRYGNPKAQVTVNYAGVTADAWKNPTRGKELALGQYGRGVDIIFAPAGATNLGVFDAAEEKKKFAIGVDSNQNWIKPGFIITSMLKRVDVAVFETIQMEKQKTFKGEVKYFGVADRGIDYAVDKNNEKIIEPYKVRLDQVKNGILTGKILVPDYYKQMKK